MSDSTASGAAGSAEADAIDVDELDLVPRRGRRWLRWSVVGIAALVIAGWAVVAARGLERDPTVVDSPLIGQPAPDFRLPALEGGSEVASGDHAGRIYVVNFWASWCVPCREEAPHLQRLWERSGPEVGLIGVVYQDEENDARAFRDELGLTFPQVTDPGGRTALDFGVFGIPETFVVDERGVVMAKLVGAVGPDTLDQVLAEVSAGDTYSSRNDDYRAGPGDG